MSPKKLIYCSTIPLSLNIFCRNLLRELHEEYDVVVVSSPAEELEEIRVREGVRCIPVLMHRNINPIADIRALIHLVKVFRLEQPDAIHSFTPKAGLLCQMAARLAGVPVRIHTFTGLVWPTATGLMRFILKLTDRLTCLCATHIIPEGEGVKDDLYTGRITRKPMQVLGYGNVRGVDVNYWAPPSQTVKSSVFKFIFVGRLVRDKGINELVEAFLLVNHRFPQTQLILVGWTEKNSFLSARTLQEIKTNPAIRFMGSHSDVRPFYAEADCLVFPSYREGFPNVVLEAGAMELPAIVTDINGSREIICNEQNGLIVPPRDVKHLCDAMLRMVEDKNLYTHLKGNARSMVVSRYEQTYVRKCLKNYYKSIL